MIRLQNVANLNLLYKVLIQTPYINISRTFIHRHNSSLQFPELKVSLLENSTDISSKISPRILFSKYDFREPDKGFQEISIQQVSITNIQIENLKILMKDLVNKVMIDYVKEETLERNDTLNLLDYILKNITYLVKEEIIC